MSSNPYYGTQGYGTGGYGNEPLETLPIGYYIGLLTSQYANSKKLNALLYVLLKKFDDASQCLVQMDTSLDLDSAIGAQLDMLGATVGAFRTVNFHAGNDSRAGVSSPMTSSGSWLVPFSIASTFSFVGMMIGMKSVIPLFM